MKKEYNVLYSAGEIQSTFYAKNEQNIHFLLTHHSAVAKISNMLRIILLCIYYITCLGGGNARTLVPWRDWK